MQNIQTATCLIDGCNEPRAILGTSQSVYCPNHLREHLAQLATGERDDLLKPLPVTPKPVEPEVKICAVDGCNEPRMKRANGTYHPRCTAHMREYWNKASHGELVRNKKVCMIDGCNEERHTASSGFVYQYCEAHQKEYARRHNTKHSKSRQASTDAQQHAGFDRDPQKAVKGDAFKLCIINYDEDTMTFVEGRVTRRCKTDMLKLLPGGWQLLLDGHAEDGYVIVQRGTPPPLVDLDSRYDWSD